MMQEFVSELRDNLVSRTLESPVHTCAVSFTVVSLGYLAIKGIRTVFFRTSNSHSYPPGPPQEFLIGALRSFPTGRFLERFCEWGAAYGDIVYAPIPGMKFLIINSHEVAQELLNKRPNSTSGRRFGYLVSQGVGFGWNPLFIPPGDHLFHQRKMLRRAIGPHRVGTHDQIIEFEIGKLMTVLETFQGEPDHTIQYCIGRMVSKATYGTRIWEELGEDLAHWNLEAMDILNETMFGFWPVDMFQFLRFVPDWVPGLRYKQLMRKGNALSKKIRNIAYNRGVELYKSGVLGHGILNDLLEEFGESEDLQDVTGILYLASSDTTTGGVIQFLHTLFLFPAIAERVFEEIRSITHGHRLPQVSDRPKLPYTEAAWKEALRLRPFFPIGMPHVNLQDEIIRGYFIPKGTMIQPNNLMILNDPRVWGDPEVFRPERFLEPDADQRPNPITVLFGWGMRVCPGMYLADRIIFHLVATIISLYKVEPLEGHKIPDRKSVEYAPKAVQQPIGFKCRFIVRDEKARHLLKTVSLNE